MTAQHDVHGPVAITGAASGIGLATARLVAAMGCSVAMLDRDDSVHALAGELCRPGVRVVASRCDVGDEGQVARAFAAVAERLGPVRSLVTAAGIDRCGRVHELSLATWDQVVHTNLGGTFLSCRAALGHMRETGGGAIVCISSPFARVAPVGGAAAYCASKGGVSALVRAIAVDYAAEGIRANALLPGPTETPLMWSNVAPQEVPSMRAALAREVPLGYVANPIHAARAAVWLLSDGAAYVTGSEIACDGGVLAKAPVTV